MPTDAGPSAPPQTADDRPSPGLRLRTSLAAAGMLPVLVALCIAFSIANGRFASLQNAIVILQQASVNLVLACGMTFVILTAGIDLSVGSILAAAAMAGLIVSLDPNLAMLAIPAALAVGAGLGLLNGAMIAGLHLPPFIVTLGGLTAIRGIARLMGEDRSVFNSDLPYAVVGNGHIFGIPWLVVIALGVVLASWFILRRTVFGLYVYAIGGNPEAARLAGIKVGLMLVIVYGISGLLAGLGGVMASARLYAANGQQLGLMYELDAVAAVILGGASLLGGAGSVWGTVVGALIIAVLTNGLILVGVSDVWQFITKGLIIIGAVTLDRFRSSR
ncbi:ABC transporter permease subunit [Pseudoroseicyclus sp. CXY001]|uniref:ABC transporter permease subunit n=1 Tax=Pseudoroseicyclus sp. CXY001 TaxID=3242492 RepID=UPI0035713C3C